MSMDLMVKAMKAKVGSSIRKLVLIKLADNANDKGECWPSYQHVADQCEISRRSAIRHINELEKAGFVSSIHREGPKGNTSNLYRLNLHPSDRVSTPSDRESLPPSDRMSPRTSHSFETVIEPYSPSTDERRSNPLEDAFNEFWKLYPKKVSKAQAYKSWKKIKPTQTKTKEILAALQAQITARSKAKGFVPEWKYPSTWLNAESWMDELPKAEKSSNGDAMSDQDFNALQDELMRGAI